MKSYSNDLIDNITVVTLDGKEYIGNKFEYKDDLFVLASNSDCVKLFPKENIKYIQIKRVNIGDIVGD